MKRKKMILLLTATTTALMAGLFFSWSCSITLGLRNLSDTNYIAAMQSINREIQNPLFFSCFFGAAILLPVSAYMNYSQTQSNTFWLLASAAAFYLVGVIGVTIVGNIPLNQALDTFNLKSSSIEEISRQRAKFEIPWNNLNTVRTVANIISLALVLLACIADRK